MLSALTPQTLNLSATTRDWAWVCLPQWGKVDWIHSTLLSKPWESVGYKKAMRLVGKETVIE